MTTPEQERFLSRLNERYERIANQLDDATMTRDTWSHSRAEFLQSELRALEKAIIEAIARLAPQTVAAIDGLSAEGPTAQA